MVVNSNWYIGNLERLLVKGEWMKVPPHERTTAHRQADEAFWLMLPAVMSGAQVTAEQMARHLGGRLWTDGKPNERKELLRVAGVAVAWLAEKLAKQRF